MLNPVDQNDLVLFEDLVDDAVVAAPCGAEALEFTYQRLPEPLGVLGDWPEDGLQGCMPHLVGKSDEVAQTLRGDLDLVHEAASDVIAETKPLALGRFSSRPSQRLHQLIVSDDVERFLQGFEIVGAHEDE
jgi:hypothetical protein